MKIFVKIYLPIKKIYVNFKSILPGKNPARKLICEFISLIKFHVSFHSSLKTLIMLEVIYFILVYYTCFVQQDSSGTKKLFGRYAVTIG